MTASLLVIAAHCDDAELWAGGTIARLLDHGTRVHVGVAHSTDQRQAEAQLAAAVLGYLPAFLASGVPLREWVSGLLDETQPEVLVTHPSGDPHFEHDELHSAVVAALTASTSRRHYPRRWYSFDTYYGEYRPSLTPVIVDITASFARKEASLRLHTSQNPDELIRMAVALAALRGMQIRTDYGEAFFPFPLLGRWPILRELP